MFQSPKALLIIVHVSVSDTDISVSRYSRYNYNYIFVHGIICTPFVEDVVLTIHITVEVRRGYYIYQLRSLEVLILFVMK